MRAALTVLLTTVMFQGCATMGEQRYQTPRTPVRASPAQMLAAASRNADTKGWAVLRHDVREGVVEALTPVTTEEGVETREHWYFRADQGALTAERVFEVRWSPSDTTWVSTVIVCDSYEYSREHEELAAILAMLGEGRGTQLASRPARPAAPLQDRDGVLETF